MKLGHGNHYGPLYVMHQQHVIFLCAANASRHALEGANAIVPVSDAQSYANVKVDALIMQVKDSSSLWFLTTPVLTPSALLRLG